MLANESYRQLPTLGDTHQHLNLAWTLDERNYLDIELSDLVADELLDEARTGLPFVSNYMVRDPYGSEMMTDVIADHFRVAGNFEISCGSGAISILHALSLLSDGRPTYVLDGTYPDLPHWITARGGQCVSGRAHARDIERQRPSLVLLDRPSTASTEFDDLDAVLALCAAAARSDAIVVVDESYGNYCQSSYSALGLVPQLDNLIVLRGMSKAYWLGGLRLAFCGYPLNLSEPIREALPPMLASSLSLRVGRAVLERGDIARSLRARILDARTETLNLLARAGISTPVEGSTQIPHVLFDGPDLADIDRSLTRCGIIGKFQPFWCRSAAAIVQRFRLAIPLLPQRMSELEHRLTSIAL